MIPAYIRSLPLRHQGDCSLLGVLPDGTLYVEELYEDNSWLVQYVMQPDGTVLHGVDEAAGDKVPLPLPVNLLQPVLHPEVQPLNFTGTRLRGLRDTERITETVQPLTVAERFLLAEKLQRSAPTLIGLAESSVLASAQISSGIYCVCRRLRFAYSLPHPSVDAYNQPYDYDTLTQHVAHFYTTDTEPTWEAVFAGLPGVDLNRPLDCLCCNDVLYIADGGDETQHSRIHMWSITPYQTLI